MNSARKSWQDETYWLDRVRVPIQYTVVRKSEQLRRTTTIITNTLAPSIGQSFARDHRLTPSSERKVGRIINPNKLRMIVTLILILTLINH